MKVSTHSYIVESERARERWKIEEWKEREREVREREKERERETKILCRPWYGSVINCSKHRYQCLYWRVRGGGKC